MNYRLHFNIHIIDLNYLCLCVCIFKNVNKITYDSHMILYSIFNHRCND